MLTSLAVLPRLLIMYVQHIRMAGRTYAEHRFVLPQGAIVRHPEYMEIGAGFGLSEHCFLSCQDPENGSSLKIGDSVKLNIGVMINADRGGKVQIGNRVLLGPYVIIRGANHKFEDAGTPIIEQGHLSGEIVIEDDVWIGAHAVVLPNVRIGRGAVIAAGSVVSRDVPPLAVAAGAPAAVIRYRGADGA